MTQRSPHALNVLLLATAFTAVACDDSLSLRDLAVDVRAADARGHDTAQADASRPDGNENVFEITPQAASIPVGAIKLFTASLRHDGTVLDVTANAKWWSTDVSIAGVEMGLAKALMPGVIDIVAEHEQYKATARLTVIPGRPAVTALRIVPPSAVIPLGAIQKFTAVATTEQLIDQDVTNQATWQSSKFNVAVVDASGRATGMAQGTTVISVSYQGLSATATLDVSDISPCLQIQVLPITSTVLVGATQQFDANCVTGSGTIKITSTVNWKTSDPQIAAIDLTGLATGLVAGSVQIIAAHKGVTGQAQMVVNSP